MVLVKKKKEPIKQKREPKNSPMFWRKQCMAKGALKIRAIN